MEQFHVRCIVLVATADKIDARKAEAEALLKQIQDGADFAQIATQKSEEPLSKDKGGDFGWAPRGLYEPEFNTAVFSMNKAFNETFLPWVAKLKSDAEAAQKIKILLTDDQLVTQSGT